MKKIKEKPTLSERIKEKAVSTPRELLHRGLDDGSERLRTQLRDTAQHGQADEYGGDAIEDTAARGLRRAEKELTRQRKKKPQEQAPEGGAPTADGTVQKPSAIKGKDTTSAGPQTQTAAEHGRQQARQNAAQKAAKVKTKDIYIGAQTETQVTVAADPQRQGQQVNCFGKLQGKRHLTRNAHIASLHRQMQDAVQPLECCLNVIPVPRQKIHPRIAVLPHLPRQPHRLTEQVRPQRGIPRRRVPQLHRLNRAQSQKALGFIRAREGRQVHVIFPQKPLLLMSQRNLAVRRNPHFLPQLPFRLTQRHEVSARDFG